MKKCKPREMTVFEAPAHLRELGWRIQGLAHLIAHQDPDAVPSQQENFGIGRVLREIGEQIIELSSDLEGTR